MPDSPAPPVSAELPSEPSASAGDRAGVRIGKALALFGVALAVCRAGRATERLSGDSAEVYSMATFVVVGALRCTLLALEHGQRRIRLAAGFLLGLTLAGHMAFAPCAGLVGLTLA